jgi:hypothetical protein
MEPLLLAVVNKLRPDAGTAAFNHYIDMNPPVSAKAVAAAMHMPQ